ncbi:hypothetical protein ABZT26_25920 [Streptomyces sp. NPDC005395]|uniref:hypothetical protein n=1 Tax=Streptomyces sp. NPDC005395 TaxID=3157042 RepID=UPI0033B66DAC
MTMSEVGAQLVSILVSALGLVIFRIVDRYLPEDPAPVPREDPTPPPTDDSTTEGPQHG